MLKDTHVSPVADTVLAKEGSGSVAQAPLEQGERVPAIPLARGASVGRYLILEPIGAGGMGIVYAAYDPKLDRRIALKALSTKGEEGVDTAGQTRLAREAKAMARLSHPNVVAVFDVLTEEDRVLVAMELVEGTSLRAWLQAKKRGWREVLAAFIQAGRGLASAHVAGLVHRDFKLDNVFMGNDGRVKVGDFGLARVAPSSANAAAPSAGGEDVTLAVSREGALVGTPAYMAPDQLRGAPADERSDQFSFCAALHEGLYGVTPYEGRTLLSLLDSMNAERMVPVPPRSDVPRRLRAIVSRGLRRRPEDRFPSMAALLAALETDPGKGRTRRVFAASALALVALAVGGVIRERREHEAECRAVGRRAETVWGDRERGAVHGAFLATGRPYAEDTFQRTSGILDAYAAQWSAQAVAACAERGETPGGAGAPDLAHARATCRDARLAELGAFVGVLGRAEGETVDRAVRGARALPSLDTCLGRDQLQGDAAPSDPTVRNEAHALQQELNLVTALRAAGRFGEELTAATKNVAEAERIGFAPLTARALLMLAWAHEDAGQLAPSEGAYHRATLAAEGASAWPLAARAFIGEATCAYERGDFGRADERFDHAAVWVDRVGEDDALGGFLLLSRARELVDEGKYDEARPLATKALAAFERARSDEATDAVNELGILADMQGRYEEAKTNYTRARDRYVELLGPEHPKVGAELNNLGLLEGDQGHLDEGIRYLTRALEIAEHAHGINHPSTIETTANLAGALSASDRYAEALPLALRAVDASEKVLGADTPDLGFALGSLAISYIGLHRPLEAIAPAEHELAIRLKMGAPVNVADARYDLGRALFESGRDKVKGRALLREARAAFVSLNRPSRVPDIDLLLGPPPGGAEPGREGGK